jgi:hypothetical protein
MADKKISELTQLTSANRTTDVLPIVDGSLSQTNKITTAEFPMSASAIARSYPYTRDFISNIERTRNLTSITATDFESETNLTSIYIGSHVTSIENNAFKNCTNLTSVTITNNVTSIGSSAFYNCTSLTSITIPDGVTSIGSSAFYNCTNLATITSLAASAPALVGSNHFNGTTAATTITVPKNSTTSYQTAGNGTTYGGLTIVEV